MMYTLYLDQHAELDVYRAILLKQQSAVNMSLHDTLSWFRANQYLLLFLNAASLAENSNKYQFTSLWFHLTGTRIYDLSRLWCNRVHLISLRLGFRRNFLFVSPSWKPNDLNSTWSNRPTAKLPPHQSRSPQHFF